MRTVRPQRRSLRRACGALLAVAALLALSACSDEGDPVDATTTSASSIPSETTASQPSEEPSETESDEPTEEETTPADTVDVDIEVSITGDTVTTAADRVALEVGQTVRMTVTSDADDEIHVHGFELEQPLVAGTPAVLEFEVGTTPGPGLYEVELHDSGLLLLQLEVR